MKDCGLVSIITPCYNSAAYVADAIRSVLRQTYENWEMIIVDDASTDESVARINPFLSDSRIRLLINASNRGAAECRNRAQREARGRWMAFLDADDQWMPVKLEKQLQFMTENNYKFTYTQYTETNEFSHDLGTRVSGPARITAAGMRRYCWPGCLTVMFDRHALGDAIIPSIRKNNDYAMWLRLTRKAPCYLLAEPLAIYRQHEGSLTGQNWLSLIEWHYRLFRQVEGYSPLFSTVLTMQNLVFGALKKIIYVKNL